MILPSYELPCQERTVVREAQHVAWYALADSPSTDIGVDDAEMGALEALDQEGTNF